MKFIVDMPLPEGWTKDNLAKYIKEAIDQGRTFINEECSDSIADIKSKDIKVSIADGCDAAIMKIVLSCLITIGGTWTLKGFNDVCTGYFQRKVDSEPVLDWLVAHDLVVKVKVRENQLGYMLRNR